MVDDFNSDDFAALVERLRVRTKKGSARDLQARRTLARMLRSSEPLEVGVRFLLADAVDPDRLSGAVTMPELKRKRGRPGRFNKLHIAAFIYQRVKAGVPVESAVKEAEDKFGVGSSTAYNAWSEWRPYIERNPKDFECI
jgi:hypothetical protein